MRKILAILAFLFSTHQAHAIQPPPNCANDGSHAEVYNTTLNSWSCVSISGGGGSISLTANSSAITLSPSTITGTGTVDCTTASGSQIGCAKFGTGLSVTTGNVTVNNSQNISTLSNLTTNGFVKTSGGTGALSIDTNTYLTANQSITLSGDMTGSGTTSIATTLATVNASVGTFGSGSIIPSITVNGKGLITGIGTFNVIAPAGTLTGTTLNSSVVTSSLTSVGTIGTGVWNGTRLTSSFIPTDVAYLDVNQTWTKGQAITPASCGTLSAGGTYTPDFSTSNSLTCTFPAGNITIANPTNVIAGQTYQIALTQDATGGRSVTWGTNFKWTASIAPVLSATGSAKDVISCWADTTSTLECGFALAAAAPASGPALCVTGSPIAAAATIAPTACIQHVTGISTISTITLPTGMSSTVGGSITLIADAAWLWTNTGNISNTGTASAGVPYTATYDGSKWYIK